MRGGRGKLSEQENQRRRKARAHKAALREAALARRSFIEGLSSTRIPTPLRDEALSLWGAETRIWGCGQGFRGRANPSGVSDSWASEGTCFVNILRPEGPPRSLRSGRKVGAVRLGPRRYGLSARLVGRKGSTWGSSEWQVAQNGSGDLRMPLSLLAID
jgi:hypothetical protein